MKVRLVNYTPEPERTVTAAARTCYSKKHVDVEQITREKAAKMLEHLIAAGHHSTLEHACFTFAADGISRACSHQLVRHRIASYSQQSQRYVNLSEGDFVVPDKIKGDNSTKRLFEDMMAQAWANYKTLVDNGIPEEDARYLLPNAATTSIVFTMNARELLHFFNVRLCLRAQWEIREMAELMLVELKRIAPKMFQNAAPICKVLGYCPEHDTCGLMPQREDVLKR